MSRCGCGTGCACRVVGGDGVNVTGNGSASNPYRIDVVIGTGTAAGCLAVMACVGTHLGPMMVFDGTTSNIAVKLSTDAPNQATTGSDGGLLVSPGGAGTSCGMTVAGLAAAPNLVGGDGGLGINIALFGFQDSYEKGVAASLQLMSAIVVRIGGDGTWVVVPAGWNPTDAGANDPATTVPVSDWYFPHFKQIWSLAGLWYGMRETDRRFAALRDILRVIKGRAVLVLDVDATSAAGRYAELRDFLIAECATAQVIVNMAPADWAANAPLFTAAGIAVGAKINSAADATAGPPANAVAAGLTWAFVTGQVPDATITPYKTAGLQTVLRAPGRIADRTRAITTLALRGALLWDPIYYRQGLPGTPAFTKINHDNWWNPMVSPGWIHPGADVGVVRDMRGRQNTTFDGWVLQADNPAGLRNVSALMGWANTAANGVGTTVLEVMFPTIPPSQRVALGLIAGATTDHAATIHGDNTNFGPNASGYAATIDSAGVFELRQIAPGGVGTVLGTASGGPPTAGVWNKVKIIITSTTVAAQLLSQSDVVLRNIAPVTNSAFRGPYIHAYKQQGTAATPIVYLGEVRRLLVTP